MLFRSEVEEEDTSIMDAVNRRMAKKEAEEKAAEEQIPQTVESLQTSLNPVVEEPIDPQDDFSDFDPDAAGLLPADEETDTPKSTEEAVDGQTKPVSLPVQKETSLFSDNIIENEGRKIDYQGIQGILKVDKDGLPYVLDKEGEVVYIESGLSGKVFQELGIKILPDEVINEIGRAHV